MESSPLDRFLTSQEPLLGERPAFLAYGRVLSGLNGLPPLVYLLVGAKALHVLSAVGKDNILGFATGKDEAAAPPPVSFPRSLVSLVEILPAGRWERFWAPKEVVDLTVNDEGPRTWRLQFFSPAKPFLDKVAAYWQ